jgi:hypothetical protein
VCGKSEKFGCGVQIGLGSQDVVVAHIGGEPRKTSLQIDALSIPSRESMDRECVANIIGPGSNATSIRLQPGFPEKSSEGFRCRLDRQALFMGSSKETIVRLRGSEGTPSDKITIQLSC